MPLQLFDQQVYVQRRNVLKQSMGANGIIVLLGNEESSMNYKDNHFSYRQDSSFLYYFGLDVAGLAAIIDTDTGEEVIFGNELSIDDIIWTGVLPTVSQMAAMVGVAQTRPYNDVANYVSQSANQQPQGAYTAALPPRK
jgi:Xaa-Pro aminopeptidase